MARYDRRGNLVSNITFMGCCSVGFACGAIGAIVACAWWYSFGPHRYEKRREQGTAKSHWSIPPFNVRRVVSPEQLKTENDRGPTELAGSPVQGPLQRQR